MVCLIYGTSGFVLDAFALFWTGSEGACHCPAYWLALPGPAGASKQILL